jgi:RNA polymerase sigma-70 factor (ECF subfamily)
VKLPSNAHRQKEKQAELNEDRRLVDRMLAGEQRAFDDFFERFFDRLYRFALIRVNQDPDTAEDVVQQTLCRAMQRIGLYRGEAALFTWLCQICRNMIADTFRATDHTKGVSVPFEESDEIRAALESLAACSSDDPQQNLLVAQIDRLVHVVLDHLPSRYGDVLELKYIRGLSVKEIATTMQIGPKAVESLLARAREAFRDGFATVSQGELLDELTGR